MPPETAALPDAFYLPAGGDRFVPTEATTSPWDDASQHGGPPTALLATVIDRTAGGPGMRLARITAELLGPIPRRELSVTARTVRHGRRVAMTEATLSVDDRPVVLARAWHISPAATPPPPASPPPPPPEGVPDTQTQVYFPGLGEEWGYGRAVEWRATEGGFATLGPARLWTRLRIPLIAGEPLTGLQRALVVADAANGISSELPFGEWMFVPPSVTVHLQRHPVGEWVHLAARTAVGEDGVGLTTGVLSDPEGRCGVVDQPLLLAPAG